MSDALPSSAQYDASGAFVGHDPNEGCEHRTVGSHRAWCFACTEWCYPSMPCVRCERAINESRAGSPSGETQPGEQP